MSARDDFVRAVAQRVAQLQETRNTPSTTAALARLRQAVGKPAGADPRSWAETMDGIPVGPGANGDEPTVNEQAAHTAITLYALHQQSRPDRMHQPGASFGSALRELGRRRASDTSVKRRFDAAATATDLNEFAVHARGLISQLRAESIPIDYGLFADDLRGLQLSQSRDRVRLRWGRDYYRYTPTTPSVSEEEEAKQ